MAPFLTPVPGCRYCSTVKKRSNSQQHGRTVRSMNYRILASSQFAQFTDGHRVMVHVCTHSALPARLRLQTHHRTDQRLSPHNKRSKSSDIRPHHHSKWTVQSYSPGGANVHPFQHTPTGIRTVPVLLLESCFEFNDHLLTTAGMSRVSPHFVLKIAHRRLWTWASSNTRSLGPTRVHIPSSITIG